MFDTLSSQSQPQPLYSVAQWQGSESAKFKGGRKHDNHPRDQLDNLLIGHSQNQCKLLGPSKRRTQPIHTANSTSQNDGYRSGIRTTGQRNASNVCFTQEHIPKLIKIPPSHQSQNSMLFRHQQIGQSKIKNLQNGKLQTGIYRNFYKSQFKDNKSTQLF